MCYNEHFSMSPHVHVSISVWCHRSRIPATCWRIKVYHGTFLLNSSLLSALWVPAPAPHCSGCSKFVTVWCKTKEFALLTHMSLLPRSFLNVVTGYLHSVFPCIAYSHPLCIFVFFFLTDLSRKFFWVSLPNCVHIVLYNLQSTFHYVRYPGIWFWVGFLWPQDS